jgi:hypothetical protein
MSEEEVKTCPLYCHWTDEETDKFTSITSKWEGDWGLMLDVDCLPAWVYELNYDEFMVKLTKDKDEKPFRDVLIEYTGCSDLA